MAIGSATGRTDAILVTAAKGGSVDAFTELVERHYRAVFLTCLARLNEHDSADDLAQEVVLRAYLHLDQLTDGSRFAAWVCRIARNVAEDWCRQQRRTSRLLPLVHLDPEELTQMSNATGNPRAAAEAVEREKAVRAALAALPAERREIVLLYYVEGLTERAIANRVGLHRTTVRYHRLQAVQTLTSGTLRLFQDAASAFSSMPNSISKASAAIVAVAAMSAEAKGALAAVSSSTMPSVVAASSASAARTLPLLKLLGTIPQAGAALMKSKMMAAAAAAAFAYGGAAYYQDTWKVWQPPARVKLTPVLNTTRTVDGSDRTPGVTVTQIVGKMTGVTPARLLLTIPLPTQLYDVSITGGRGARTADTEAALRAALERNCRLTFFRETRPASVLVLGAAPGGGPGLKPATSANAGGGFSVTPGHIASKASTIAGLARRIEEATGIPVIDETAVTGYWQMALQWDPSRPDSLQQSLRQQMGLSLVPQQREVEFVVLSSADTLTSLPATSLASLTSGGR